MEGDKFSIHVRPETWLSDDNDPVDVFTVELPHQCDEWIVAQAASRDEAAAQLRGFIADATEALRELESVEVCDHDWWPDPNTSVNNAGRVRRWRCGRCNAGVSLVEDASQAAGFYRNQYPNHAASPLALRLLAEGRRPETQG